MRKIAISAIDRDFETFLPQVREINELMESGPQRDTYLLYLIRGLIARKQYDEALERLVTLALAKADGLNANEMGQLKALGMENFREVSEEQWVATNFHRLFDSASSTAKRSAEERLLKKLKQDPTRFGSNSLLERYTRFVPATAVLRLYRAVQDLSAGDLLRSEQAAIQALELSYRIEDQTTQKEIRRVADSVRLLIYRQVQRYSSATQLARGLGIIDLAAVNESDLLSTPLFQDLPQLRFRSVEEGSNRTSNEPFQWLAGQSTRATETLGAYQQLNEQTSWPNGKIKVDEVNSTEYEAPHGGFGACKLQTTVGDALKGWSAQFLTSGIQFNDPLNQSRFVASVQNIPTPNSTQQILCHFVNSVALFQRGGEIIAVDTLSAQLPLESFEIAGADFSDFRSVLWQEPVNQEAAFQSVNALSRRTRNDMFEFGVEKPRDTGSISVTTAGQFGIVIATAREIQCLDYLTGETLWKVNAKIFAEAGTNDKEALASNPWIAYHDEKVFIIDPVGKRRVVVDARDGELIQKSKVTFNGEIWAITPYGYLTYIKNNDGQCVFELCSNGDDKVLLQAECSGQDKADLVDDALVIWGEEELQFLQLRDLKSYEYPVAANAKLRYLRAHSFQNTLLLLGYVPSMVPSDVLEREDDTFQQASGSILAIDASNGQPRWKQPIQSHFLFPLQQPRIGPAFVLARPLSFRLANARVSTSSIALVDLATGELLYQNDYLRNQRGARFHARLSPVDHSLTVSYRTSQIVATWTGEQSEEANELTEIGKTDTHKLQSEAPPGLKETILEGSSFEDDASGDDLFGR